MVLQCLGPEAELLVVTMEGVLSGPGDLPLSFYEASSVCPASPRYLGLRLSVWIESGGTLDLPLVSTSGDHRGLLLGMHHLPPGGAEGAKAGFEPPHLGGVLGKDGGFSHTSENLKRTRAHLP